MKYEPEIYCSFGPHFVKSAAIHDLSVKRPMCKACRKDLLSNPVRETSRTIVPNWHFNQIRR